MRPVPRFAARKVSDIYTVLHGLSQGVQEWVLDGKEGSRATQLKLSRPGKGLHRSLSLRKRCF